MRSMQGVRTKISRYYRAQINGSLQKIEGKTNEPNTDRSFAEAILN